MRTPPVNRHGRQLGSQNDFDAQPLDSPSTGNPSDSPRKLAFFRKVGAGDPMWSGSCIYNLAGRAPSFSQYDVPDPLSDLTSSDMSYRVRAGVATERARIEVNEPTMTRNARVSAHFDSSPAARTFQSFASVRWSGLMSGFRPQIQPRPLVQSFNPNQVGAKELHPATQYKPFPPMGSLVPAYGEQKAL